MKYLSAQAKHILLTHRNWWLLHTFYIIVLSLTFFLWGVVGAMYFATAFASTSLANVLFILYAGFIISLPGWFIHIRAAVTFKKIWKWRWSIVAQLLYYVLSIVIIIIIMLCISYV